MTVDEFTGDGSDTTFTLSVNPISENNTFVYLDGVYQEKATYSVSGNNIKVASTDDHFGKITAPASATAAATLDAGTYDINTAGSAFSFSESWTSGDSVNPIGTGVDVAAGVVADMPAYGTNFTSHGGVAGNLAGTITSAGAMTLTAGGAGTTATGQFVSEVTIR